MFRSLSRQLHRSCVMSKDHMIAVPPMGDSISEGTIVEIVKGPGEVVSSDEIIVILETDKISVDVRTPVGGKVTMQLGKIDDVVQVGTPLFHIDDAFAQETTSTTDNTPSKEPTKSEASAPVATTMASLSARSPLIHFLGKRSLLSAVAVSSSDDKVMPLQSAFTVSTPSIGILPISEEEIQAVNSGFYLL